MPIHRHFLNWDAPVTQRVREFLLPDADLPAPDAPYRAVNLQHTLVVVPTRQAARRLSGALVQHCATRGIALMSARIVPPTFLLQPDPPDPLTASATTVTAAWAELLQHLPPAEMPALAPPDGTTPDFDWALRTGQLLQDLRDSLSDGAYRITDVVRQFHDQLEERERWENLAHLETRYLAFLAQLNLHDPLAARMHYAQNPVLPPDVTRVIVASVPDPSLLLIQALTALATSVDVHVLIHAPPESASHFDDWGRPRPEHWTTCPIHIPEPETCLLLEESPRTQGTRVASLLRPNATLPPANDVAIGVPDATVAPFLSAALETTGLTAFDPADRFLHAHAIHALLDAFADLAADQSYGALARLLRHPDILARLANASGPQPTPAANPSRLLTQLDTLQNACLPTSFDALEHALASPPIGHSTDPYPDLRVAAAFLRQHLDALQATSVETALRAFLQDVYRHRELNLRTRADAEFETVADHVDRILRELNDAPDLPDLRQPARALRVLGARLATERYHPVPEDADVDLEGWLELPWNHAPRLIVTGLNEGSVPDTRLSDAFLPDSLRTRLALRDDSSRLARDSYLLASLLAPRAPGQVVLITGKLSPTGDPLKPSRLLFRCPDAELRTRALRLFGSIDTGRPSVPSSISFRLNSAPTPDLRPTALRPPRLPVTAFRDYLACPFRFYLRWLLDMQPLDDEKSGLDARDFGMLIHHVLETMAESGLWRSADEPTLRAFMNAETDRWLARRYGTHPPLAITLAADAARQRLGAAARTQVALTNEGWEIIHTEQKLNATLAGQVIVGKIDRIDRHRDTGQLRIIDYKTSDRPSPADTAHLARARPETPDFAIATPDGKRSWIDLQLPLYVTLLGETLGRSAVQVGYFNLPKATGDTALALWENFDHSVVDSATRCAEAIIRRIHARIFWPPTETVDHDDFESLFPAPPAACFTPPFPDIIAGGAP